ncbi:unnamed protein product, partial [Pleuronectes platessa]
EKSGLSNCSSSIPQLDAKLREEPNFLSAQEVHLSTHRARKTSGIRWPFLGLGVNHTFLSIVGTTMQKGRINVARCVRPPCRCGALYRALFKEAAAFDSPSLRLRFSQLDFG